MSRPPANWVEATLLDIVELVRGRVAPQTQPDEPFIGMENVEAHSMKILGTVPAGTMKSSAVSFQPGDVLYGRLRPYLNKVVSPDFDGLASAEFIPLTPKLGVERDFVRYRINSADFVQFAARLDEGDRPRVDWEGISSFRVLLPPSAEQTRIVEAVESCLSRLDAAVASLERVQAKLKTYRASVLKAAFEGRLVASEAEIARQERREFEPASVFLLRVLRERRRCWEEAELNRLEKAGKIPKNGKWNTKYVEPAAPDTRGLPALPSGWCYASAEQLTTRITDGEHATPPRTSTGVLLLSARNVGDGVLLLNDVDHISEETHATLCKRLSIESGDVLLSCSGSVGRSCVVPTNIRFSLVRSVAVLKPIAVNPHFLSWSLASPALQDQIHRRKSQTAQANIFQGSIKQLVFALSPQSEQDRIVETLQRLFSVSDRSSLEIATSLSRTMRVRQAILKWAFEGKLVDQDANDEPAEQLLSRIRGDQLPTASTKKIKGRKAKAS
jgi:type I restriction enzyme S subunit